MSEPGGPGALTCLNCGNVTGPSFCGHCGQEVEAGHGNFLSLLRELAADWFSLDGKLLRTFSLLARPGRLTETYLGGRKVIHLRPFRLYLIASLLLFSSILSLETPDAEKVNLSFAGELITSETPVPGRLNLSLFEGESWVVRWLQRQEGDTLSALRQQPPQEILDAVFGGMRRVLPSALILFVPFLALALRLLYLRSGVLYVDHLIFALHLQSAFFLALALIWLPFELFGVNLFFRLLAYAGIFLGMLLIYMPMALGRVYEDRRWRTTLKSLGLIILYVQLLQYLLAGSVVMIVARLV